MPGILPMKVIKVGSSSQSRIAQACDRCRSKKIRCDGIRPSCTQCINVGFECKTSDKLSRRAFPRGYTESLEERVRQLESEIRELKDLLDEKDEKIDMLSRIHSRSPRNQSNPTRVTNQPSTSPIPTTETPEPIEAPVEKDDTFKVEQSPIVLDEEQNCSYFAGTSSGRALVGAFKEKAREAGRTDVDFNSDTFFNAEPSGSPSPRPVSTSMVVPPRLVSDQLVNIFFQEWAPLFPVLHRPAFLALYGQYVTDPESIESHASLSQLNLVFGIAAISSGTRIFNDVDSFETQWLASLEKVVAENTMDTLQCIVLAQIYCMLKGDTGRLLKFKGMGIGLSHRLGLHQSQKRFGMNPLVTETRKKLFWAIYTLDCFSAAQLGLPKHLNEDDIHCEYPVDIDDEYVTEKGLLPTLPGESTKLSSALALFRASRILAKVLAENYPTADSHEISLRKILTLSDELDAWLNELPPHLRLQYAQDKPSTRVITDRAPVLALAYEYIRSLIHRPAVCAELGDRASSSIVALGSASKHVVLIVQLLEERGLSFSFCANASETLLLAGFGILFQTLPADRDGKLVKDSRRLLKSVSDILEHNMAPGASEFRRLSASFVFGGNELPPSIRAGSDGQMPAPQDPFRATQKHLKALAARFTSKQSRSTDTASRRATVANLPPGLDQFSRYRNQSAVSLSSIRSEPPHADPLSSASQRSSNYASSNKKSAPNLDFLSFSGDPERKAARRPSVYGAHHITAAAASTSALPGTKKTSSRTASQHPRIKPDRETSESDWARLLGSLDNGKTNIYDTIYGGVPAEALADLSPPPMGAMANGGPLVSGVDGQNYWELMPDGGFWNFDEMPTLGSRPPQSVLSFSDESLTSGGDEFTVDFGMGPSPTSGSGPVNKATPGSEYRGIMMPEMELGALDGNFGL